MEYKIAYFTFGWGHAHASGGFTYDKDVVVEMHSPQPRESMFELFGDKWSFEYPQPPDMSYFPRGIKQITHIPKCQEEEQNEE